MTSLQREVLRAIPNQRWINPAPIAKKLDRSVSTICKVLNRLRDLGLCYVFFEYSDGSVVRRGWVLSVDGKQLKKHQLAIDKALKSSGLVVIEHHFLRGQS